MTTVEDLWRGLIINSHELLQCVAMEKRFSETPSNCDFSEVDMNQLVSMFYNLSEEWTPMKMAIWIEIKKRFIIQLDKRMAAIIR